MTTVDNNFRDPRTQHVLGFFVAKGLLIGDGVAPRGQGKLALDDVFWVAEHVEPRVLEVLPAALIHFPKTFLARAELPDDLRRVLDAIKAGKTEGPDFRGMRYRAMYRWANRTTADGRTKPLAQIKRNKTLRLSPAALAALESGAAKLGLTQTEYLESLLLSGKQA